MTFAIHGLAVARGIAIGRAVLLAASHLEVAHYFITAAQVAGEIARVGQARDAVVRELQRLQAELPRDAPSELAALLDVHLMLLQDEMLEDGVKHWISERLYNAEWALMTQFEVIARQFDEMEDEYLRERKADLEQVVERILRHMRGLALPAVVAPPATDSALAEAPALVLVAPDLAPADLLQFKQGVFAGFVTATGGKTSHTAIVARSMDIPAVVGARAASQLVRQDDWVIIDGDAGVLIVDPSPILLDEYRFRQRQLVLERERLARLRHTPCVSIDGEKIELLANIEQPADAAAALRAGAVGVGLFRTEFLFMGRSGHLPDEQEQYLAYREAVEGMQGLPVTIRTIDVGADKPLDKAHKDTHLNPALGLRAIRWSLADPVMFRTQMRAILRAAQFGPVNMMWPMITSVEELKQCRIHFETAQRQLTERNETFALPKIGCMIEIPSAALTVSVLLKLTDFISIGTNDLIQYTLSVDRSDDAVSYLYQPAHPAVLNLLFHIIRTASRMGKSVSICGEIAGDTQYTRLLLAMGLRRFSMNPANLLAVKDIIIHSHINRLEDELPKIIRNDDPEKSEKLLKKLNEMVFHADGDVKAATAD